MRPRSAYIGPDRTIAWAEGRDTGIARPDSPLAGCAVLATFGPDGCLDAVKVSGADAEISGDELNALLRDTVDGYEDASLTRRLTLEIPNACAGNGVAQLGRELLAETAGWRARHGDMLFVEALAAALELANDEVRERRGHGVEIRRGRFPSDRVPSRASRGRDR